MHSFHLSVVLRDTSASSSSIVTSPINWAWADLLASCFHTLTESRFSGWLWHKMKQFRHAQRSILQILSVYFFNSKEVNYRFYILFLPLTPPYVPVKNALTIFLPTRNSGSRFLWNCQLRGSQDRHPAFALSLAFFAVLEAKVGICTLATVRYI